jgi:hypothetical protein
LPSSFPGTLQQLLDDLPPILITYGARKTYMHLRDALEQIEIDLSDPLTSAIILDISRGVTAFADEVLEIKEDSWGKELALVGGVHIEHGVNWEPFFGEESVECWNSIHPNIPVNPTMARTINRDFRKLREKIRGKTYFSRYTHKNMPRETRREYEIYTGECLDGVPIFGQDDWIRLYHRSGHQLGGATEMRQRWYTSGVKPRTYFAMGGEAYASSRFLQGFFSDLVDFFPSTNHQLRLRTGRLVLPSVPDKELHWRVYDLSSFTSNCSVQRSFCYRLAEYFRGVEVILYDERFGPLPVDLGEVLYEYVQVCVERPSLSLERYSSDLVDVPFVHEVASLLGIFGNLMTCTSAHFLITSPFVDSYSELNCAGDDELLPEDPLDSYTLDRGISIVGVYERTKSFRGNEECVIQLKRPFLETIPNPTLLDNIIPPTVATAILLLASDKYPDDRFRKFASDNQGWVDAVSVVGKDLMRFLVSAWRQKYTRVEKVSSVYYGFCNLIRELTGYYPTFCLRSSSSPKNKPYWPVCPYDYEFLGMYDPMETLVALDAPKTQTVASRRVITYPDESPYEGSVFEANQDKRYKLLETLGYLAKVEVEDPVPQVNLLQFWCSYYTRSTFSDPVVYEYTVLADIPVQFM